MQKITSPSEMKPTMDMHDTMMPEMKNMEVGDEQEMIVFGKMVGKRLDENGKMYGNFEITKAKNVGSKSHLDKLRSKYD
jgi:hypothetical protein